MRAWAILLSIAAMTFAGCGEEGGANGGGGGAAGSGSASPSGGAASGESYIEQQIATRDAAIERGDERLPNVKDTVVQTYSQRYQLINGQLEQLKPLAQAAGEPWTQKVQQIEAALPTVKEILDELRQIELADWEASKVALRELDEAWPEVGALYAELREQFGGQLEDPRFDPTGGQQRTEGPTGPPGQ